MGSASFLVYSAFLGRKSLSTSGHMRGGAGGFCKVGLAFGASGF
jgi:hypothetical protein